MCFRYLGLLLLIWFPGLHAQEAQLCPPPELTGGYFVIDRESKLNYACDSGKKPAAEGWWATSICQKGAWSPKPLCIDQDACTSPDIPNAEYKDAKDQYDKGFKIRVKCKKGYELINNTATAICENGTWSSLPVCEKSDEACGPPIKIINGVIINQEYQDVFAVDSEVHYECKDGFTVEGADTKKSIVCITGRWNPVPQCRKGTSADRRQSGSGVRGADGRHTTSAGSGRQPSGGGMGTRPDTGHGSRTQPAGGGAFCVINPADFVGSNFKPSRAEHMNEGETKNVPCIWPNWSSRFHCTNRKISFTPCCHNDDRRYGRCQ